MRPVFLFAALLLALALGSKSRMAQAQAVDDLLRPNSATAANSTNYVQGELLVKFKGGTRGNAAKGAVTKYRHKVKGDFEHIGWQHIQLSAGLSVADALLQYRKDPDVLAVEPNAIVTNADASLVPNDPLFQQQWALTNIYAPYAWGITNGSTNVVVAVIDSGINYLHEDLVANMWHNPGEIAGNGIDDDNDGFIDDVFGADFGSGDGDPMDEGNGSVYHGTAVASIIGAVGDNAVGMAGVSWHVQLMAVRYEDSTGNTTEAKLVGSYNYVLMMKQRGINVRVVNSSHGFTTYYQSLKDSVDALNAAGVVVASVAHNLSLDIDITPYYPGAFNSSNVICVAASTSNDRLAGFSDWGRTSVDLTAPGVGIVHILGQTQSSYSTGDGTSYAAPLVSGSVALLSAQYPNASVAQLKEAILNTVDIIEPFQGMMVTGGRLNIARALLYLATNQPPVIIVQPAGRQVLPGGNASITVGPGGTPPLSYQWYQGQSPVVGATNALLKFTNVQTSQTGLWVQVSNSFGSSTSAPVSIVANPYLPPVVAWGANQYGECDVPTDLTNVVSLAGGRWHTLALQSDGTVRAWGESYYGECNVPASLSGVRAVSGGVWFSVAVSSNGTVTVWGNNSYGQTNMPAGLNDITAICCGQYHTLALRSNGTVVAWGFNTNGDCNVPSGLSNVAAISAGFTHSLALQSNGTVVAWGDNTLGQCNVPSGLNSVRAIVAGYVASIALKNDGTVAVWGANTFGQLNVPSGLTNVIAISGYAHFMALKSDGTVVAWGAGTTNSASGVNWGQAIVPPGLSNVTAIASIGRHSLALITPPPIPTLTIAMQNANPVLSWPASAANWQLLTATNLVPPVDWQPWSGSLTTNQNTVSASLSPTGQSRFFRLRGP